MAGTNDPDGSASAKVEMCNLETTQDVASAMSGTVNNFEESDYEAAEKVCRDLGRISRSAIQRHLRIGYVKACLIVEAMGECGIAERVDPDGTWVFTANAQGHAPSEAR